MIICPCRISVHDWTLTLVSVCVIFVCLIILSTVYSILGKINVRKASSGTRGIPAGSTAPVQEAGVHDIESGVITISSGANRPEVTVTSRSAAGRDAGKAVPGSGIVKSPLPGVILKVFVKEGQEVKRGEKIAVLEAMKMENDILSEKDGTVFELKAAPGDSVLEGAVIAKIG